MALKKPDELFEKKKGVVKNTPLTFNENVSNIRTQFNKVDALKKQLEDVSVSLNNSLTEVVDNNVNLISFKTEYDDLLNGLNDKIEKVKEEFSNEVKEIKKYQSNLSAEVTIIEQRQKKTKLNGLKEEIIIDVKNLLSGDVLNNIKNLEEKVDLINEKHIKRLNESYSEPPNVKNSDPLTPTDQKFVNLDDFQNHYRLFLNRIQRQLSTLGGGGAVLISDLDDVETSTAKVNGKFLKYNSTKGKWEGADAGGVVEAFKNIAVSGQSNIVADATTDTLTFVGGSNVTITTNASNDTLTIDAANDNTQLTTESVQDIVGAMFSGNTETNITATYQDSDGTIDLVSTNTQLSTEEVQDIVGAMFSSNTETGITATYQDSDGTIDLATSSLSLNDLTDVDAVTGAANGKILKYNGASWELADDLTGGSGTGLSSRTTTSASTGSIAQASSANITIPTAGKSFSLLKVAISAPAYVVLYVDSASRSSDSSRSEGTDPVPGSGVLTEVSTTTSGASTFLMTPAVLGWNNDGTPASQIYAKVVNKRATSGSNAITVTLTSVALEA